MSQGRTRASGRPPKNLFVKARQAAETLQSRESRLLWVSAQGLSCSPTPCPWNTILPKLIPNVVVRIVDTLLLPSFVCDALHEFAIQRAHGRTHRHSEKVFSSAVT